MKKGTIKITQNQMKLARQLIRNAMKTNRLPNTSRIHMSLDAKMAQINEKIEGKATTFDYWITLSTLNSGKPIRMPVESNDFYKNLAGTRKNFLQVIVKDSVEIAFIKDIPKRESYKPRTDVIGLDLGMATMFTSSSGAHYGKGLNKKLEEYDRKIQSVAKGARTSGVRLSASPQYRKIVGSLRSFLKNEAGRVINKIIRNEAPERIRVERLDFQSPKLGKRMNRLLSNFGKGAISRKLEAISEEFGIKIEEVNSAYTSQECHSCGYIEKKNRKSQSAFVCGFCEKKQNADTNASRNISRRSSAVESGSIYTKKELILKDIVSRFFERFNYRRISAKKMEVIMNNPYFALKIREFGLRSCAHGA